MTDQPAYMMDLRFQSRLGELRSLHLKHLVEACVDDARKSLEPHLQQAAIHALGERIELMMLTLGQTLQQIQSPLQATEVPDDAA